MPITSSTPKPNHTERICKRCGFIFWIPRSQITAGNGVYCSKKCTLGTPWERFISKVNKSGPTPSDKPWMGECWVWTGSVNGNNYGHLRIEGKYPLAHRFSYEKQVGKIPDGMEVMHVCNNSLCVNPSHLRVGTHAENMQQCHSDGRFVGNSKIKRAISRLTQT